MSRRATAYLRFLAGLPRYLVRPITFEQARRTVARRLEEREAGFLRMLKRCVYENPASPYLPLLRRAGCEYSDAVAGVRRWGLDGLLRRLLADGVRVAFEEFKGRKPICRPGLELPVREADFDSPRIRAACCVSSGGSSGRAVRAYLDLEHLAARSVYDALFFRMLGIEGLPLALWYPGLPATTGVSNSLRYARIGQRVNRWFLLTADGRSPADLPARVATAAIVWVSRFTPAALPKPLPVALSNAGPVLQWLLERLRRGGRAVVQSYVSQAVRISQMAASQGLHLSGTQFIVGSEPLTDAKRRVIEAAGAAVFPRYHSTEIGTMGIGCGNPSETGELHLAADMVAAVQGDPPEEDGARRLFFTTLTDCTPKVMINVEMGDSGVLVERDCGCLLHRMGLRTHILRVRSADRATVEGMSVPVAELTRIAEQVLAPRAGLSALDVQWVEREDERGLTRLFLRVSARLGPIDEAEVAHRILEGLRRQGRTGRVHAGIWSEAGSIRIVREEPRPTARGKMLPFVRE